jgi:transposase
MFVAQLRRDEGLSLPWLPILARHEALTPRAAATILLHRLAERPEPEQTTLVEIRALHAELDHLTDLSERYTRMIREQESTEFDGWMDAAHASGLAEVRQFARNMRNDEAAIRAALKYPWSQGQVEGQVHRLKLVKRAMYGRAKFDLLRQRVLHRA